MKRKDWKTGFIRGSCTEALQTASCSLFPFTWSHTGGVLIESLYQIVVILLPRPAWHMTIYIIHHCVVPIAPPLCSSPLPLLHLLYCFLPHLSLRRRPRALRPPLTHSPPAPPLLPDLHYLLAFPLSIQICDGAHSLKILPLHSNAPPHCSLCCYWCRRRRRDVKLHQRRLHIASARFPVVSRSWKLFPSSFLTNTLVSSLPPFIPSYLRYSLSLTLSSPSPAHLKHFPLSGMKFACFQGTREPENITALSLQFYTLKSTSRAAAWAAYKHRENK